MMNNDISASTGAASPVPLSLGDLLHCAGLLAGLGAAAQTTADELLALLETASVDERTCVDGGSPLMFSVLAPGGRELRTYVRTGMEQAGIQCWQCSCRSHNADEERWQLLTFVGEPAGAWERVQAVAESMGRLAQLQSMHSVFGPHGRLHAAGWSENNGTLRQAKISWQLDRSMPVDRALDVLGLGQCWTSALSLWHAVLGFAPQSCRGGPWSLSLMLRSDEEEMPQPRLRLGSTNWARNPEFQDKRRRLANAVEAMGGDRRYAEGLYRLIASAASIGRPRAVGRAVELELAAGRPVLAEFYMSVP